MSIIERDTQLSQLHEHLEEAATGRGHLVFLGAEAGGGKTALIEEFAGTIERNIPVSVVSCDSLGMPGPFGPLFDIASALGPHVEAVLNAQAPHDQIFRAVLSALQNAPGPNVLVGEDAHWTDEATLDLVRFLGRRIGTTRTLVIITHRDDSLDPYHPLRRVLGDLVSEPGVSRMWLPSLSRDAVQALASDTDFDPAQLYERTGGNPFYVAEIVASGGRSIPTSIRDAVLSRAAQISTQGRSVLDIAATLGSAIDLELLAEVAGVPIDDAIDECLAAGLLRPLGDGIAFRHELTRDVFLSLLSSPRRRGIHRRILKSLEEMPAATVELAHLAHHAEESRDREAVLKYAPAAAKHSARYGAHREAAAQYARTLRFAQGLPDSELADLLEARSYECYLTGQIENAITDRIRAVELRADDPLKLGDSTRWLSRFCWFAGRNADAHRHAQAALELLEPLPPGPELAMAYSNMSQLCMLANDAVNAIHWGERAIALATELNNQPILAHALNNVGAARSVEDHDGGLRQILEGARIARDCGLHDDVSRALTNVAWMSLEHYELEDAARYIEEGIAFTSERDLIGMETHLRSLRAQLRLSRGDWDAAALDAGFAANHPGSVVPTFIVANTILGLLQVRRGERSDDALDIAEHHAMMTGELQRLGPLRCARAEAAWLANDPERAAIEAEKEFANALRVRERWMAGNLALWMHRGGRVVEDTSQLAEPFALEIDGDGRGAAAVWHERGYPIEEARALESAGDEQSLREALAIFDRLGAKPDSARVIRSLRDAGVRQIPRGPRPQTRANAALLTARELEVLRFVTTGLSNREIADRLFLSSRTVGHHVSAILAKLEISSRSAARTRAEELGLL
jgi:DNA-binding CsgD family transcriptional regulator/tetratricopeptide (TPR) repeat protein